MSFFLHSMDNFNKFLQAEEELKMLVRHKSAKISWYFSIFLFLLAFFMLWPMIRIGRQGLFLWLAFVFFIVVFATKKSLEDKNVYLLTTRRLLQLTARSKEKYYVSGAIKLSSIEKVNKTNSGIYLLYDDKKYYLNNILDKDKLYKKIKHYINQ